MLSASFLLYQSEYSRNYLILLEFLDRILVINILFDPSLSFCLIIRVGYYSVCLGYIFKKIISCSFGCYFRLLIDLFFNNRNLFVFEKKNRLQIRQNSKRMNELK